MKGVSVNFENITISTKAILSIKEPRQVMNQKIESCRMEATTSEKVKTISKH